MCNTGECRYEHPETGECERPICKLYPSDSACVQKLKDFNLTKEYLKCEH